MGVLGHICFCAMFQKLTIMLVFW